MRFLIALCFIAAVSADKLGYNYQPVEHSDAGLSFQPGTAASQGIPSYAAPSYSSAGSASAPSFAPSYSPAASASAPSYASPVSAASGAEPSFAAPAGVDKEFFSFSANDEDFLEPASSNQVDSLLNQNVRVIFIKGPEHSGLENAALALAKQASDRKTDIYVLNKQADLSELASKLKNIGDHSHSKPEVHFVKYRTPEDAANAQRAIQSEYEGLGGKSQSHDGGVASAINFASAPAPKQQAAPSAPEASYLPASIFKRLRF